MQPKDLLQLGKELFCRLNQTKLKSANFFELS